MMSVGSSRTQKQIAKITRWSWPLYAVLVPLAAWNAWLCRDNGINAVLGWVLAGVAFATLAGFCRALHNLVTAVGTAPASGPPPLDEFVLRHPGNRDTGGAM